MRQVPLAKICCLVLKPEVVRLLQNKGSHKGSQSSLTPIVNSNDSFSLTEHAIHMRSFQRVKVKCRALACHVKNQTACAIHTHAREIQSNNPLALDALKPRPFWQGLASTGQLLQPQHYGANGTTRHPCSGWKSNRTGVHAVHARFARGASISRHIYQSIEY